jgi:hypothetical protein
VRRREEFPVLRQIGDVTDKEAANALIANRDYQVLD